MENFFYNGTFFNDIVECCEYNDWDIEEIQSFDDDFKMEIFLSDLEPIYQFTAEHLAESVDEDRFSEDNSDKEFEEIVKILNENIDFDKINLLIPKLYYESRKKHYLTKEELLKFIE